jgi:hypothetical protein
MSMCVSSPCDDRSLRSPFGSGRNATSASLLQMSASTETTKSLTVTTDDGDKVTLTTHTAASLGYARYDYRGRLDGERVRFSAEALNVTVSQDVSLSVEGDLSDQEKADIAKLVGVLEGAVKKDAADDPTGTLASALADNGDLGSLAGFEYTVTRAVNVSIAQVQRTTKGTPAAAPATGGSTPAVPAPTGDPVGGTSSAPASSPATQAAPASPAKATGDDDSDDKSVKNLADAIHGSGIRVDKLLRHLRRILDQLAQRLDLLTASALPAPAATDSAAGATDPAATSTDPAPSSDASASA